jgi:hypothetical protein
MYGEYLFTINKPDWIILGNSESNTMNEICSDDCCWHWYQYYKERLLMACGNSNNKVSRTKQSPMIAIGMFTNNILVRKTKFFITNTTVGMQ